MTHRNKFPTKVAGILVLAGLLAATAWANPTTPQPEVAFDAERGKVTVRVSPRHLHGITLPLPLRQRLTVLEDGVPQPGVSVDVEHAPMTVAVLIENGGRSSHVSELVSTDAVMLTRPLLDVLGPDDRLAVFAYDDSLRTVVEFDTPHQERKLAFGRMPKAKFSEANFYDAALAVLNRLADVPGPKALLMLSTGVDTFSQATFADVLAKAEQVRAPIYVFKLGELVRHRLPSSGGLLARVDWARCERQLEELARASGGRAYRRSAGFADVQGIYDEIVEELKVRYVLTYTPAPAKATLPRQVSVAVRDSISDDTKTAEGPTHGGSVPRVIAEVTYTPVTVTTAVSAAEGSERR
jgi:hypothetical protein